MEFLLNIANRIKELCDKKGISINKMLLECNAGERTFYNIKSGSAPSIDKIYRIANYLDCSIDYLVGRGTDHSINTGDITNSNFIAGNNNSLNCTSNLSVQEYDLLNIYRLSDGKTQMKIMQFIYNLDNQRKEDKYV